MDAVPASAESVARDGPAPHLHGAPPLVGARLETCARAVDDDPDWCSRAELRAFADEVMGAFRSAAAAPTRAATGRTPADQVFELLTHRRFSYLGQTKAAPYRAGVLPRLAADVAAGRPVRFYFDIGPGYHASLDPERLGISFEVGLAELLALRQVALFDAAVRAVHPPGVRFSLVVDNVCGLYTNGVPLDESRGYATHLRALIGEVGLAPTVDVLLESECSPLDAYERLWAATPPRPPVAVVEEDDLENVARFLGRACGVAEGAVRIERYRRAGIVTEALLAEAVADGVRLTQRATAGTLAFRSFPGGAQRMQVGEIVLGHADGAPPRPLLLTSRNRPAYAFVRVAPPAALPPSVRRLGCARATADVAA